MWTKLFFSSPVDELLCWRKEKHILFFDCLVDYQIFVTFASLE